jgi:hypothetical protein
MAFGNVTLCDNVGAITSMGVSVDRFFAQASPAAGGANDFCTFVCNGPTGGPCTVKVNLADGLPVELLSFGVE